MNDREWEDYVMGNPASPYPRVQDSLRLQQQLQSSYQPLARRAGPSGPSVLDPLFQMVGWIIAAPFVLAGFWSGKLSEKFFLFRWTIRLGKWVGKPSRKISLALAGIGLMAGGILALAARPDTTHGIWIGCAIGFVAGWLTLPSIGGLLRGTAQLIAFCISFAFVLILLGTAYTLTAAVLDWPQVWEWRSQAIAAPTATAPTRSSRGRFSGDAARERPEPRDVPDRRHQTPSSPLPLPPVLP